MKTLFLSLFLPVIALGQKTYEGVIIDKATGNAVPYASVGLITGKRGTTADQHGQFRIQGLSPQTDSVRISSVGYETLVLPLQNWPSNMTIQLWPKTKILRPVVVSNRPKPTVALNEFRKCGGIDIWTGVNSIYQRAQRFEAPEEDMQLIGIDLCKDSEASIFRLRIYAIDSLRQCPGAELTDSVIEVRSDASKVKIDLQAYNVIVPGKSFFVALEWLFISENEKQERVRSNGKKVIETFYKPYLQFVETDGVENQIWESGMNGEWFNSLSGQTKNFQITTKLR